MRGRKRTPTALALLKGNPGRRPLPAREPQPEAASLAAPRCLDDEGRAEWGRVAPMLARIGVLSEADVSALIAYCEAWSRWRRAEEQVRLTGLLVKTPNGYPVINPLVAIANKAMSQMRAFLVEFGMTPSARTRVEAQSGTEGESKFREFLAARAERARRA